MMNAAHGYAFPTESFSRIQARTSVDNDAASTANPLDNGVGDTFV